MSSFSLGDDRAVESKSGANAKKGGTNMRPWTTTHGTNGPRYQGSDRLYSTIFQYESLRITLPSRNV